MMTMPTTAQKTKQAIHALAALLLLVAVAHNGAGHCTVSSEDKVTFQNNKVTDTFSYCGDVSVGTDAAGGAERQSVPVVLERAVARFRLVLTDDELPPALAQLKFYYLGGSSTFSPALGLGIVQSRQTELRDVTAADGPSTELTAHADWGATHRYSF